MITLDILSDPICPWCYIGKTHLDRALEQNAGHPFQIEWHPFQLNPEMPAGGMDRRAYLEAKFGGKDGAVRAYRAVEEAAETAGLQIDFAKVPRVPNTLDAHRLIHWAGHEGRQSAVVAALFRAYWRESRDIGARETLIEIAGECGLDAAMITRLIDSDADAAEISARDAHARQRGVNGVPCFIIGNQYAVSGAQPPQVWGQIIAELLADQQAPAPGA